MNPDASAVFTTGSAVRPLPAFGGVWRLTYRPAIAPLRWLMVAGALVLVAGFTVLTVRPGNPRQFYQWTIEFYFSVLVPILAFISGGGAIRDDMKPGSADYLLTRPVRRPVFVAYRYLCHLGCEQAGFLLALAVVIGAGFYRDIPGLASALLRLLLAQVLLVTAFTALGFLGGAVTSRFVVLGMVYGVLIENGIGRIPLAINQLSVLRNVKGMLHPVFAGSGRLAVPEQGVLVTVAVVLGLTLVWVALAAAIFSFREFVGERAKEP